MSITFRLIPSLEEGAIGTSITVQVASGSWTATTSAHIEMSSPASSRPKLHHACSDREVERGRSTRTEEPTWSWWFNCVGSERRSFMARISAMRRSAFCTSWDVRRCSAARMKFGS